MTLKTVTVPGVELIAAGTWQGHNCPEGGCRITGADIDEMVHAYESTKGTFDAPVKLGHDDQQKLLQRDGYPAAGWVTNLRRVGDKLVGDLEKVPALIADLMKSGAYRKRSSEIRPNAEVNGQKFKWVFSGLALLGADLPAVEGLADIEKLYASLRLEKEEGTEILYFEADNPVDSIVKRLEDLVSEAESLIRGQRGAPKLRHLVQAAKEELRRVAKTPMEKKDMTIDEKALRELLGLGEDADVLEAVKGLKTPTKTEEKTDSGEAEKLAKELSAMQARVLELEKKDAEGAAAGLVSDAIRDGKLLPAQKEFAMGFALRDADGFKKFVESQPKVLEFGERGSSGNTQTSVNLQELEPTESEIKAARALGMWSDEYRLGLMKTKAVQKGIELPLDFGKKKEEQKS